MTRVRLKYAIQDIGGILYEVELSRPFEDVWHASWLLIFAGGTSILFLYG